MIVQLPDHLYFGGLNFNMEYELMINLKNSIGIIKQCPVGFSWTTFFFGPFVPLFRGDFKWFLILLVLAICTGGISSIILAFHYNKIYIRSFLLQGYIPMDDFSKNILQTLGVYITK